MDGDSRIWQCRSVLQPVFVTQPSSSSSCTLHALFILFMLFPLSRKHRPCIEWINVFEPLISPASLFLVTPCWIPAFYFSCPPYNAELSLWDLRDSHLWIIPLCEFFLDLLVESKLLASGPVILIFTLPMCLAWYLTFRGWKKGFGWIR